MPAYDEIVKTSNGKSPGTHRRGFDISLKIYAVFFFVILRTFLYGLSQAFLPTQ
ncbi:hypothetical protein KL86DES1_22186 [uncultured Desulfovibrio sp.]|uniref:Uncharacterized protein n=1 Tax=uncultured Desulfovibrio sp. TaxID=167968 RepID=A0A212LBI0_9BACT|nr:hypothetical protein KL86DES1_22186 [uncultured Desulfovibrio sp.]VZH35079.1 conserved protein of unknown function [Desulfovibrio sp. 86]